MIFTYIYLCGSRVQAKYKVTFWQTNKTSDQAPDASAGETAGEVWYHGWSTYPPKRSTQKIIKNQGLIRTYKGKPMVNKHSIRPYFLGVTLGGVFGRLTSHNDILRSCVDILAIFKFCWSHGFWGSHVHELVLAHGIIPTISRECWWRMIRMVSESKAYTREVTAGYAFSVASWIPFFIHKHEFATTILFARWNEIFWANQHTVANDETLLTGR